MNYKTPQKTAFAVTALGVIGLIFSVQPLVFPKVVTGVIFGSTISDNKFSLIGLGVWLSMAFSVYVLNVILRGIAEILWRLPEKPHPNKIETEKISDEEIIAELQRENGWSDDNTEK